MTLKKKKPMKIPVTIGPVTPESSMSGLVQLEEQLAAMTSLSSACQCLVSLHD